MSNNYSLFNIDIFRTSKNENINFESCREKVDQISLFQCPKIIVHVKIVNEYFSLNLIASFFIFN